MYSTTRKKRERESPTYQLQLWAEWGAELLPPCVGPSATAIVVIILINVCITIKLNAVPAGIIQSIHMYRFEYPTNHLQIATCLPQYRTPILSTTPIHLKQILNIAKSTGGPHGMLTFPSVIHFPTEAQATIQMSHSCIADCFMPTCTRCGCTRHFIKCITTATRVCNECGECGE
jgi:hypothetical protein